MKNLKNYAMALVALVIAATSVTLMSFAKSNQTMVTLYFQGDTQNQNEIEDASNWVEQGTPPSCNGEDKACSISVNAADATGSPGSRQLNPSRITLEAIPGAGSHYVPQKNTSASTSPNPIDVQNQDL